MKRREVITSVAAVFSTGCIGYGDSIESGGNPTESPRPTTTADRTEAVTQPPGGATPEVVLVNLVSEWGQFGDIERNVTDSVTFGDPAIIAFRANVPVHDGTVHLYQQARTFDGSGNRVDIDSAETEQLIDETGAQLYENVYRFDTSISSPGPHMTEIIIRDEVTGKVSAPGRVEFGIVEAN